MATWIEIFAFCSVTVFAPSTLPNAASGAAQEIMAQNDFRPALETATRTHADKFESTRLVRIDEPGGWARAHRPHFPDGGTVDQIYCK